MTRRLVPIVAAVLVGIGASVATRHIPLLAAGSNGSGCAVGHHSTPVGEHSHPVGDRSKPCPTPPGCAIGNGQSVGRNSKPCPTPPGCAAGNGRSVGSASKPCPTPPGCAVGNPRFVGDASKPCPTPASKPPVDHAVNQRTSPTPGEPEALPTPDTSTVIDQQCANASVSQCSGPPHADKPARNR